VRVASESTGKDVPGMFAMSDLPKQLAHMRMLVETFDRTHKDLFFGQPPTLRRLRNFKTFKMRVRAHDAPSVWQLKELMKQLVEEVVSLCS
jgi:hypothetical protein